MLMLLLWACVGSGTDSSFVEEEGYHDSTQIKMYKGQEWRVLIELYRAVSPKLVYEITSPVDSVQISVFDGDGELLWIQDTAGPEQMSFSPLLNCDPSCSLISKAVYLSGEGDIDILLGIEASSLEGIVLTSQP